MRFVTWLVASSASIIIDEEIIWTVEKHSTRVDPQIRWIKVASFSERSDRKSDEIAIDSFSWRSKRSLDLSSYIKVVGKCSVLEGYWKTSCYWTL